MEIDTLAATVGFFGWIFDWSTALYLVGTIAPLPVLLYFRRRLLLDTLSEDARPIAIGVMAVATTWVIFPFWRVARRLIDHAGHHDLAVWMINSSDLVAVSILLSSVGYGLHLSPALRVKWGGAGSWVWMGAMATVFFIGGLLPNLVR